VSLAAFPDELRPGPLEVACGLVLNVEPAAPPLGPSRRTPRAAIDDAIRPALLRPPCLVSFSGGRDSSAILAAAAALARREGLALPIPATHRFPAAPATQEDRWQEEVVAHLALPEWVRLTVTAELDCVGPVAQSVLRRRGVVWPFNAHLHVPLFERAAGGSMLTGVGGDELFGPQRWQATRRVLSGRVRPRPRHVRTVALALAPAPLRRAVLARRREIRWPWLHPHVDALVNRRRAAWEARTPLRWAAATSWWWQSRRRLVLSQTLSLLGADAGAQVVQPFLDAEVLAAAASHFGARGPTDRTSGMRGVFGDVLPESVLARGTKATFDDAFFAGHSRAFVAQWTGGGVDAALVDLLRLARVWNAVRPDPRSFSLMQAAWLAGQQGTDDRSDA
jgi:asparagine synthetase B (glutamine-hydrolysing)